MPKENQGEGPASDETPQDTRPETPEVGEERLSPEMLARVIEKAKAEFRDQQSNLDEMKRILGEIEEEYAALDPASDKAIELEIRIGEWGDEIIEREAFIRDQEICLELFKEHPTKDNFRGLGLQGFENLRIWGTASDNTGI